MATSITKPINNYLSFWSVLCWWQWSIKDDEGDKHCNSNTNDHWTMMTIIGNIIMTTIALLTVMIDDHSNQDWHDDEDVRILTIYWWCTLCKSPFSNHSDLHVNSIHLTCPVLKCTTQIWLTLLWKVFLVDNIPLIFPIVKWSTLQCVLTKIMYCAQFLVIALIHWKHCSHLSIVMIIFWKRLQMCWKLTL